MRHTLSLLVENRPGVLARIAGLFSARGYNIASLAVSETLDPTISYMTMVVEAEEERVLEQIKKQLNKLIDVIKVIDFTKKVHIDRELILVKINYSSKNKSELENVLGRYVAKLIQHDTSTATAIIEAVGDQAQIRHLMEALTRFGVKELVRTGRLALSL